MNDNAFARIHGISESEAVAYRRGAEAKERGAMLHSLALSTYDAWFCAGWHDADIASGHSVLEGNAA
ncbi:MAG TPA: hypothetical protein VFM75_12875 [Modicisalibacter sp.]|nr:hypothetical protein [Modicisalibacter sp.]